MKKTLSVVISSTLLMNGCSTLQPIRQTVSDTFASEDPCSNNARNIGLAAGAVVGTGLGVIISKATGGDSKKALLTGAVLGAGAVAASGWFVGKNIDQRRCELHKIAERYHIRLHATPISVEGQAEPIGLAITLPENTQNSHFASGSDVLSAPARKYFTEIARQYSLSVQLDNLKPNATENEKQALRKQLSDKKILLVGHTDDTGESANNAELSERRARAVAALFREAGVPDGNLLYQGAGETLPAADNNSADGRQANRRVEIIDVNDEAALQSYLAGRRPNLSFYRIEAESAVQTAAVQPDDAPVQKTKVANTKIRTSPGTGDKAANTSIEPSTVANAGNPANNSSHKVTTDKTAKRPVQTASKPVAPTPNKQDVGNGTPSAGKSTNSAANHTAGPGKNTDGIPPVAQAPAATKKPAQPASTPSKKPVPVVANTAESINFGGQPANDRNNMLSIGKQVSDQAGFSFIGKAYASDMAILQSCNRDRPRVSGNVKQLKDGKVYAKSEHLPGLYGTTWADKVNGHLVVLNRVSLLRDSAMVDVLPQVNVYKDYDPTRIKNPQATLSFTPQVNTYRGDKGILYRMFTGKGKNLQCMDVLLPVNGGREAQSGLILYDSQGSTLIAPFQPKSL